MDRILSRKFGQKRPYITANCSSVGLIVKIQVINNLLWKKSACMGKEIYTYKAPWLVHGLHWSQRPGAFRLGFGSFMEEYNNRIQVIQLMDKSADFVKVAETEHHYPITKLLWSPYKVMHMFYISMCMLLLPCVYIDIGASSLMASQPS